MTTSKNVAKVWCGRHWALILEKNLNGVFATIRLVDMLLANEKFMRRCGYSPELKMPADTARINIEISQIGPPCCWLGDEVVNQIILECENLGKGGAQG